MPKAKYKITLSDIIVELHDHGSWNWAEIADHLECDKKHAQVLYCATKKMGHYRDRRAANKRHRDKCREQIKQRKYYVSTNKTQWQRRQVEAAYTRAQRATETHT